MTSTGGAAGLPIGATWPVVAAVEDENERPLVRLQPDPRRSSVLHVTQPVTEGVGNYVRSIVATQRALGHRVGLACNPESALAETAREAGAQVLPFRAGREPSLSMGFEIRQLRAAVREFQPDVVHLHSSKAGMAGRLAVRGRHATVFQPHAWSFEAATGLIGNAALRWERLAGRWTDAIITVSDGERALAAPHGIKSKADATILNPVDIDRYRPPVTGERAAIRDGLGLRRRPTVVCVGRLCEQKGQDLLLDAWEDIQAAMPTAQLLLVGDGPSRVKLQSRQPANTHLLGDRDDVASILRVADVVAMPSRWEGMSLAMLEAMATARPVVACDVGGAVETVGLGAGAVVPIGDQRQLAEEILRRLRNRELAETEGRKGRQLVVDRHGLNGTVEAINDVYEAVLRQRAITPSIRSVVARGQ